jgi:AcrR family transcriptional regulator
MTDIADVSGVGVATLYRYFGTKTGITIAAMTHLWNELNNMFSGIFESEVFRKQTGLKQLTDLMRMYIVLYEAHKDFMKLLGEFDLIMLRDNVPKDELVDYERSIINFYEVYESACKVGIADGTIRDDIDLKLVYLTYGHSMMELGKKLIRGEILPSDNFSEGSSELSMLIEMAASYIRKK